MNVSPWRNPARHAGRSEVWNRSFGKKAESGTAQSQPQIVNFGSWPIAAETDPASGEKERAFAWQNKWGCALFCAPSFRKKDIRADRNYIFTIRMRGAQSDVQVGLGFYRSSGEFYTLNHGPLEGRGPFTRRGRPYEVREDAVIAASDVTLPTDDFTDFTAAASGRDILACMVNDSENAYVYAGICGFRYLNAPNKVMLRIDSVRLESERAPSTAAQGAQAEAPYIAGKASRETIPCRAFIRNAGEPVNSGFIGFGAMHYPWLYFHDENNRDYTEAQAEEELDRLVRAGVTTVRCNVFAREEWYEETTGTWHLDRTPHFGQLCRYFLGVQKRGVAIMVNIEWGSAINTRPAIFGDSVLAAYPLPRQCVMLGDFTAAFISELCKRDIDIQYLTFYSEPGSGLRDGYTDADEPLLRRYADSIGAAHRALVAAGLRDRVRFVLGNVDLGTYLWNHTWQLFEPQYRELQEYADEWSYHLYNRYVDDESSTTDLFTQVLQIAAGDIAGKTGVTPDQVWFDELNAYSEKKGAHYTVRHATAWYPLHLASAMLAVINAGFKTGLVWTFVDTQWINGHHTGTTDSWRDGTHVWGLMPNLMTSPVPYASYYAFSMIARPLSESVSRVFAGEGENGVACTACEGEDGHWTIIVVHTGLEPARLTLRFERPLCGAKLFRRLFDHRKDYREETARLLPADSVLNDVDEILNDRLPAGSVAVYTTRSL